MDAALAIEAHYSLSGMIALLLEVINLALRPLFAMPISVRLPIFVLGFRESVSLQSEEDAACSERAAAGLEDEEAKSLRGRTCGDGSDARYRGKFAIEADWPSCRSISLCSCGTPSMLRM